jgi:hypothetical protein
LTYYTGLKGRGSVIVNRYFKTLEASLQEVSEETEERNAYDPLPPTVVCPQDAKMCPDGSSVSRVAPTCKFKECPSASSTSVSINTPPEVNLSISDTVIKPGAALSFEMSATDKEGGKLISKINWGDGQVDEQALVSQASTKAVFKTFSHVYKKAGKYQLTAYVIDSSGAKSSKTVTVAVENTSPASTAE